MQPSALSIRAEGRIKDFSAVSPLLAIGRDPEFSFHCCKEEARLQ